MNTLREFFAHYPSSLLTELALYGTVLITAYIVVWRWLKPLLQSWRIQIRQRADVAQLRSEIGHSLTTLLIFAAFDCVVFFLYERGATKMYMDVQQHSLLLAFGSFFLMMVVDDMCFYWIHRMLHHPTVYRYVHAVHHESIDTTPFTSLSFHIGEASVLTLWILPLVVLVPLYMPAMFLFQVYAACNNLIGHIGYEFYPRWFAQNPILKWKTTSTHHNMHHAKFNGNYGLHFRVWDKICGTEFHDYEQTFAIMQDRKEKKAEAGFLPLTIANIIDETPLAYTLVFNNADKRFFTYNAGQHCTLKITVDGKPYYRTFSLSSSPSESGRLTVTIKRVHGGRITNFIKDNLSAGAVVEASLPTGAMTFEPNPARRVHYVLIAGGSGITPLYSILKTILAEEPHSRISLLYANRNEEQIIFRAHLADLVQCNSDRLWVKHFLDESADISQQNDTQGSILEALKERFGEKSTLPTVAYLCGPQGMIAFAKEHLRFLGVSEESIHEESFASAPSQQLSTQFAVPDWYATSIITLSGTRHELSIGNNETILAAIERHELDVPYSCRSGVCGTCKARCVSGGVTMTTSTALDERELGDRWILTCQAIPSTETLEIVYGKS
ncbi:MAG: sterol desaturase family protein [Candidatus Kapaibacteriota bacterium]